MIPLSGCFGSAGGENTRPIEQALCQNDPNDPCCPGSPIIIDVGGNGFDLTDLAGGVHFNLNPGGGTEQVSWTAPGSDDAWLALDRNGNGLIDDGTELFGNFTPQPSSERPQGYLALATLDLNQDNVIDSQDVVFRDLRLWQDRNHDGVSDADELSTLEAHGIVGLDVRFTGHRRTDEHGNLFRYSASVYTRRDSHVGPVSYDVFLITQPLDVQARQQGALLNNGAASMAAVDPNATCGGGGEGNDCYFSTPPNTTCEGGAAICLICAYSGTSITCEKTCHGYTGWHNGTQCKICPSTMDCQAGPGEATCDSHIG
jgi:hypothetical protein